MAAQLVVGLYETRGYAQDARNRLHTEGGPENDMLLVVLRDVAPVPDSTRHTELAALTDDPMVLGDVENTFARFIENGETAVIVSAPTSNRCRVRQRHLGALWAAGDRGDRDAANPRGQMTLADRKAMISSGE